MAALTVKQVAEKLSISSHTLRFYDDQGLFPSVLRDKSGRRLFDDEHLEWVYLVLCLRNTGMSVSDIKYFVKLCEAGDSTIPERYEIILAQKKKAEADLEEMQKRLCAIDKKEAWYKGLLAEQKKKAAHLKKI